MSTTNNNIQLQLLARDFKNTDFSSNADCAISKAIKRLFKTTEVETRTTKTIVDKGQTFSFDYYGITEFNAHASIAADKKPSTVIATIILYPEHHSESEVIYLPVRSRHFKNSSYEQPHYCALSKAAAEYFDEESALELVDYLKVGGVYFNHDVYGMWQFDIDKKRASKTKRDAIIRFVKLTRR